MKTRILAIVAFAATVAMTAAHFNLRDPPPYNPIDCNRPDCAGPCPPIWRSGAAKARYSPQRPSRVWRRGTTVPIEWHRNNHEGGFYTRSLVPAQHLRDRAWHKRSVFEYGCWVQGMFKCGKAKSCGTDKRGLAYRNTMRVPTIFPDGDYVFAMTWFGGLHWRRRRAHFSDYYTCAFVHIRGGPLTDKHAPTFVPGRHYRDNVPRGKCVSTSSFLGECGGQECKKNAVFTGVPKAFRNGKRPRALFRNDFEMGARRSHGSQVHAENMKGERKALEENKKEQKRDDEDAEEQELEKKKMRVEEKKRKAKKRKANKRKANKRKAKKRKAKKRKANKRKAKKWTAKKWQAKSRRHTYKAGGFTCGGGHVPPRPAGAWGPRNSNMWWRKRAMWWTHYNYCLYCAKDC